MHIYIYIYIYNLYFMVGGQTPEPLVSKAPCACMHTYTDSVRSVFIISNRKISN